ncbi:metal-dependent hydrolase [Corynebacterium phocae]|uniref:Metal-dependent hydrolase n=1 Tax=Corynebacterium phocae TaxID=161895 RepID=A0A1L7D4F8_9CORY|nr:M48 family metallopeptidase [Corynebacterium phocae]APT93066.1 metal-dependent hydrolase [Corynebacterium phocae]KAA8722367.1 M48 family metallopeptidase [Corynebacterium phocae]
MSKVKVIRSARRKKSADARWVEGIVEVRIPAWLSAEQEREVVAEMVEKLQSKTTSVRSSDEDLVRRAAKLNDSLLAGQARLGSIRWVSNQNTRWGSCTLATGDIRLSDRLQQVPDYVLDSVIVHELVHTFIPGHGPDFWLWADKAPQAERAKGYLDAYERFS